MKVKRRGVGLTKMARRGFRGYPVATIAFYGPNADTASKVAVGIVLREEDEPVRLERWYSKGLDVRRDPVIGNEIISLIKAHEVKSVAMSDRIIGCPHEEGKEYPEGESCPLCPYWKNRDRFTGEIIQ